MADFDKAFDKVKTKEGGYANNPNDKGGETYIGISRRYHPNCIFWKTIDTLKGAGYNAKAINKAIQNNELINKEIKDIYKKYYWDRLRLDEINSQEIAYQLFDDAVNRGVSSAVHIAYHVMGMTVFDNVTDELIYNINHEKYPKNP